MVKTMNPSPKLSTAPLQHPALDFDFLRREGIHHLQAMSGLLWTDHNSHDPGITILEQLCYALTDLAYRISYDMPDLLTQEGQDTYEDLYLPSVILPVRPVTSNDFRKLILDVDGVKNAWIEKIKSQEQALYYSSHDRQHHLTPTGVLSEPVLLLGLYNVKVELADTLYIDGNAGQRQQQIRQEIINKLHANRGLCEDFEHIDILTPQYVQIDAEIEIDAVDDAEGILTQIFRRIANYISPYIPRHSLNDMLQTGKQIDELFDGPLLKNGFIDTTFLEQAQRRTEIRASDFIHEMMDVPGVKAIASINMTSIESDRWLLKLNPQAAPKLNLNLDTHGIVLRRNGLLVNVDKMRVKRDFFQQLRDQEGIDIFKPTLQLQEQQFLHPPVGQDRHVTHYASIQHQFPENYGIGHVGLPKTATPERQAQAKQLKAYLLFFDQLLANYFAQLAHVHELFSFSGTIEQAYFSQVLHDESLDLQSLYKTDITSFESIVQKINENPFAKPDNPFIASTESETPLREARDSRRNRFLNHLLARFAEQFTDYSLILYQVEASADYKQAILKHYPQLSSRRGTAFNYLEPISTDNQSGLEMNLRHKLGFGDDQHLYIIEHILLRPMQGDETQTVPFLEDATRDPFSLRVSVVLLDSDSDKKTFIERKIREEVPAHLLVNFLWLDEASITIFIESYHDWIETRRFYYLEKVKEL